jgi:hypothetical protein
VTSPNHNKSAAPHTQHRQHLYALESTGVLIIALTLLTITLVRYWNAMHWSLR